LSLKDILNCKNDFSYIISESSGLTTSISGAIKINSLDVLLLNLSIILSKTDF